MKNIQKHMSRFSIHELLNLIEGMEKLFTFGFCNKEIEKNFRVRIKNLTLKIVTQPKECEMKEKGFNSSVLRKNPSLLEISEFFSNRGNKIPDHAQESFKKLKKWCGKTKLSNIK